MTLHAKKFALNQKQKTDNLTLADVCSPLSSWNETTHSAPINKKKVSAVVTNKGHKTLRDASHNCGKIGHFKRDCCSQGGGAAVQSWKTQEKL